MQPVKDNTNHQNRSKTACTRKTAKKEMTPAIRQGKQVSVTSTAQKVVNQAGANGQIPSMIIQHSTNRILAATVHWTPTPRGTFCTHQQTHWLLLGNAGFAASHFHPLILVNRLGHKIITLVVTSLSSAHREAHRSTGRSRFVPTTMSNA